MPALRARVWIIMAAALAGCTGGASALRFEAVAGDAPFSCAASLGPIGAAGTEASPRDLRFYVHAVEAWVDGEAVPVTLEEGPYQRDGVALVDLEDGSGTCETNSPETHADVTFEAVPGADGVRFVLGVPAELNHLDSATAAPPLNVPKLWWSWAMGYKYLVADVRTETREEVLFHVGATGCEEAGGPTTFACREDNLVTVDLPTFDVDADVVRFDLGALLQGLDLTAAPEGDTIPGCMSFPDDPECVPVFEALGLPYGDASGGDQAVFSASL
jgi:uncharacterized repeat protein (TIGR04052 family)